MPCSPVRSVFAVVTVVLLLVEIAAADTAELKRLRAQLVDEVLKPAGITDIRVLDAMGKTLRHEFVPDKSRDKAYADMALPIGDKQTISSPFIVAYMTQSLDPRPEHKVLEIGTGSGYQAAVLSPLVKDVYTIEIVKPLGTHATGVLKRLNYKNVHVKIGDGFQGWPEFAPFDRIIATCSPEKVPVPLVEQLAEGGLMVIPVGERYQQTLYLMRKKNGKLIEEALRPTLFVPMTGRAEDNREVQPDPLHPKVINGGFEEKPGEQKYIPGWYYEQQARRVADATAPEGRHYLQFHNDEPGQRAHVLQGLAITGDKIHEIQLSAKVKFTRVMEGRDAEEIPKLAITFYDSNRKELGTRWIGPFRGTKDWHQVTEKFPVPVGTREAIVRLGLFGAVGDLAYDDVRLQPTAARP